MKYLFILLTIYFVFQTSRTCEAAISPQPLQVLTRENYQPREFTLSDEDWRWLGHKRIFKIAVWHPEVPPLSMFTQDGKYEGMAADYLMLVANRLGMRAEVTGYSTREDAFAALTNNEADIVVDVSGKRPTFSREYAFSNSFISDHPVLVHPKSLSGGHFVYKPGMRLAIASWYVQDEWIKNHFPGVSITHFDTDEEAMASVVFKRNDFFIGNLVSTAYLRDRNFSNYLDFQTVYPERDTGSRFAVLRHNDVMLRTLNKALEAIPLTQKQIIMQQWSEGADIWRLRKSINFTERERKWISQHKTVKVSINTFYAPFTMIDSNDEFYGVTADILKLISQRTGIRFVPVPAKSLEMMQKQIGNGEALAIGALSQSEERDEQLLFTRPYFSSPFVKIIREDKIVEIGRRAGLRVALVKGNPLIPRLKDEYPDIRFVETPNASVAMQNVVEDKADIAVHTLFGASYMINRYFQGQLKIDDTLDNVSAGIGFAVTRSQPELLNILNKSLENISPSDINDIISKWQTRPDVRLNTWELYRKQFWVVVLVAGIVVFTSLVWVYYMRREIMARKKAQKGLHNQLKFSETLINTLPLPVYVTDIKGNLKLYNKSFSDFFTGRESALSEYSLTQSKHPLYALWRNVSMQVAESENMHQPHVSHESIFDGEKNRNVLHYAVSFSDGKDQLDGVICTWLDMTEQEELNSALSEARERAEQANRAKSTFLATMSHEIRTPVSAIIGLLELTVKTNQSEKDKEDTIRVAWESARNLMGLIGDILDMARIESGRLELTPEWVRTGELLAPVIRVFEGLARQKGIRLSSSVPAVLPYEVFVDPLRFRQVLSNLVSNAIKFTDEGSVEVEMSLLNLGDDSTAELLIRVIDTGKGIPAEDQENIFDPWVQAREGRSLSGSGLGLAICAQLVNMMSGMIEMKSVLGMGTTFSFQIPVNIQIHRREPEQTPSETVGVLKTKLRILAVDDHPANRMLLRHQLNYLGHAVTEASDGEQGWAKWQSETFDVVITDCSMPGMDGLALTRLIRKDQSKYAIILGLTANAAPEERLRCLEAGMDDCLFKPLQLPQLQKVLNDSSEFIAGLKEKSIELSDLLRFDDLLKLTTNDSSMLKEILSVTLKSNTSDMANAEDLFELEDWPELAKCIHRIAGAAQIIGANRAEKSCEALERACNSKVISIDEVAMSWREVRSAVIELNVSIASWLSSNKAKDIL